MLSFLYSPTLTSIHDHWKNHSFDYMDFVGKVMSLLFNMQSRLVIAFLPRRKCLLISWLWSASVFFYFIFSYLTQGVLKDPSMRFVKSGWGPCLHFHGWGEVALGFSWFLLDTHKVSYNWELPQIGRIWKCQWE